MNYVNYVSPMLPCGSIKHQSKIYQFRVFPSPASYPNIAAGTISIKPLHYETFQTHRTLYINVFAGVILKFWARF
jgi:hypothetical protein